MAKNFELIEGEKSNWEIIFFLLIDKLYRQLKPGDIIHRQDLIGRAGMNFICDHLGEVKYKTDKSLENRFQGTINTMVKKKNICTVVAGTYELTNKGHERLIEIREAYDPEEKTAIGPTAMAMKVIENLDEETKKKILKTFME